MEEKGNSESLLLHIEDFCPKQVARICHSKKHLTVRSKNRFEASTNQAIYPPWHIHETDIIYNLSLNIHPSIAWFVWAITRRLLRTCTDFFLWYILTRSLAQNTFTSSLILSEIAYHPPNPYLKKLKKSSENDIFFIKNLKMSYNSTASKRAFCLEYQFGTIFCFKGASLAIESIFKWF